jgi:hypothetical protein
MMDQRQRRRAVLIHEIWIGVGLGWLAALTVVHAFK